jgi:hypothetical protein
MRPRIPATAGAAAPGCAQLPEWLRPTDARISLLAPWRTLAGTGAEPGELTWIGPVTRDQTIELAAAAALDSNCAWTLLVTNPSGQAITVTTLRRRRQAATAGMIGEVTLTLPADLATHLHRDGHDAGRALARAGITGDRAAALAALLARAIPAAVAAATQAAAEAAADAAAGGCAHLNEASGYIVPGSLRKQLNARDRTCRSPICRMPATRCDQDHTLAYLKGGRTCRCNLGAECRSHHQLKQLPGWELSLDADGSFTWRTPAGLTYQKEAHRYPV